MNKYIAILRGINVGGKRKILMKDLKDLFLSLGFNNAQTYIQSGNVIFNSARKMDNIKLADKIEESIFRKFGFEVPVIVLTAKELNASISENPYLKDTSIGIEKLHLTFLKEIPENEKLQKVKALNFPPDQFEIKNKNVFICCVGGYSQSKLTNSFFETKLKVTATTRNWKTVVKLSELTNN